MIAIIVFAIVAAVYSYQSDVMGSSAGAYAVGTVPSDGSSPYGNLLGTVITMDVLAAVFALIVFVLDGIYLGDFINKIISIAVDVVRFAIAIFLLVAMSYMISTRGTCMGFVWFSSLASGSAQVVAALNDAVITWVMSVLAIVCLCVSCGFPLCAKKAAKKAEAAA